MSTTTNRIPGARNRRVAHALLQLHGKDSKFNYSSFLNYYMHNGYFTPKQCLLLVSAFHKNMIDFQSEDFRISLRKDLHKGQLREMPFSNVKLIWTCLSKDQKTFYNEEIAKYPIKD
ncbi:MAG: hypothetical protein ABJH04_07310 [Cyclobacteriaceae bacterium]